jgi:hypothetical protein
VTPQEWRLKYWRWGWAVLGLCAAYGAMTVYMAVANDSWIPLPFTVMATFQCVTTVQTMRRLRR